MSYEWMMGSLGNYMGLQSLGLYNSLTYNLPFSSVLSNVLGTLTANGVNAQNIAGFRTISADSVLQEELNKLGYGNMMILVPEEYQKQVEGNGENAQKIGETFKKWKANYDAVNGRRSQVQGSGGNQGRVLAGGAHNCSLRNCVFGSRGV